MAAQIALHASPDPSFTPILALPLELKLLIISYLSDDEDGHSIFTMMILRRTHPAFRDIVPRDHRFASNSNTLKRTLLYLAETKFPYLIPLSHYPCYGCRKVLHRSHFDLDIESWGVVAPIGWQSLSRRPCDECLQGYWGHDKTCAATDGIRTERSSR